MHTRRWSLRYPARSFQHRVDHLEKLISEKLTKWKKTNREILELDHWMPMDGPGHERYEDQVAHRVALAATLEPQQEEIRKLEFMLEFNKGMLVTKRMEKRTA